MNLLVLHPAHLGRAFLEILALHHDAVLADKAVTTMAARHTAAARRLTVLLRVRVNKILGAHGNRGCARANVCGSVQR